MFEKEGDSMLLKTVWEAYIPCVLNGCQTIRLPSQIITFFKNMMEETNAVF